MNHPKYVDCLFSLNVDSERLQCLIDGIENVPPGSEGGGVNFTLPLALLGFPQPGDAKPEPEQEPSHPGATGTTFPEPEPAMTGLRLGN